MVSRHGFRAPGMDLELPGYVAARWKVRGADLVVLKKNAGKPKFGKNLMNKSIFGKKLRFS